jgi:hypothetical protein
MARWFRRKVRVPEWVLADSSSPEAQAWLAELKARDPEAWWTAWVEVISTPVWTKPDGPVAGD